MLYEIIKHQTHYEKNLVTISVILILAGCNGQSSAVTKNTSFYNSSARGISFDYPSNWKLSEAKSISVSSPPTNDAGTNIMVTIPAENFDEYENKNASLIQSNDISIKETTIASKNNKYTAKMYGQHGWLYYLIKVDEHFVSVGAERYINNEQEKGLSIILDSISF